MSAIAIIPARGGSRRIPRKNILPFMGRPMLHWTVEAALESGCFDRVLVSTDDAEIAASARQAGAEAPFLRESHADDHSTVSEAVCAALTQAENYWKTTFSSVAQLMPNCPLRTAEDIRAAMDAFQQQNRSFQISVFRYGWMNPWWALQCNADGTARPLFPDVMRQRSQDLPTLFCPTGAIWLAKSVALVSAGTFYGPDYTLFELSWTSALDIDEYEDLKMAQAVAMMSKSPSH